MKRAKIGDVYYVKVPNGYKLYQWAYNVPRKGDYIRVFDGLYKTIPNNIEDIVNGPHSYILPFDTKRLYRIGIANLIDNYVVPEKYPFPGYMVNFYKDSKGKIFSIEIMGTKPMVVMGGHYSHYDIDSISKLPLEFQGIKLINSRIGPQWLLYLFDTDWNLSKLECYSPPVPHEVSLRKYTVIVDEYMQKYNEKKLKKQ